MSPRVFAWWRHQMETFSALLALCAGNSPVPGEFPGQRPVTRSFDVFFHLRQNKRLMSMRLFNLPCIQNNVRIQRRTTIKAEIKWPPFPNGTMTIYVRILLNQRSASIGLDFGLHESGIITSAMVSQITNLTIVYSTVYSGAEQRKPQSSTSMAFVRGIHRWPVNSPHKEPVTRKVFPFDDVIMCFVRTGDKPLSEPVMAWFIGA